MKKSMIFAASALFLLFTACSSAPKVTRVSGSTVIDLSGYWNDTDVRQVCDALVKDFLRSPRAARALSGIKGKTPKVLVGTFYNDSSEHIDTSIISTIMEEALFNEGDLDFVAGGRERKELRSERLDQQQGFTNEATAKSLSKETGADFLLTGSVKSQVDSAGNRTVRSYFVTAQITDLETNQRIWMKTNSDIKKEIKRSSVKF
ncbi:MAG: penicillin-binding protein activator LpoB [Spirochaetaceae bacterium]|nr:penicillin-binding protein activator LpoB [Spirochaetaceae bacterium]